MDDLHIRFLTLFVFVFVASVSAPTLAVQKGDVLYTAYNIWELNRRNMGFINYKYRTSFIPAGTRVEINEVDDGRQSGFSVYSHIDQTTPMVTFTVLDTGKSYTMKFTEKYWRNTSFTEAVVRTFVNEEFAALTEGFEPEEIEAIRKGILVRGMSKPAVLVSYGYPPSHRTPSIESKEWNYWASRNGRFIVSFDQNGRATFNGHKVHSAQFELNPVPSEQ